MSEQLWNEVLDRLRMLIRLSRATAHRQAESYEGLQPSAAGVLGLLVADGDIRLSTLAERQRVGVSVTSRQVTELEERGLVERSPDPDDARAGLLRVTPAGEALHRRIRENQHAMMRDVLADWNESDMRTLVDLIDRINGDLGRSAGRSIGRSAGSIRRAARAPAVVAG